MGYISVDDLVQQMTPEQRIFVSQFYAKFDIGSGVPNKKIINVQPFFYMGDVAGSEFEVGSATKLYLCLSLWADHSAVEGINEPHLDLLDEGGIQSFRMANAALSFDGVGALVTHFNSMEITNCYFAFMFTDPAAPISNIKFIGYRITLS